jgi:hypothetical protein
MAATIELDEEKAVAAVRPDAAVRLAPQQLLSQRSILGFTTDLGLEERSQQFTVGRSARSYAASVERFPHQFTRIRSSVHIAMESGCCRRCEQDACAFELSAALSLAKLYQSNN